MRDVGNKQDTLREAKAEAFVSMKAETAELIREGKVEKGNVLETARAAGILAAKKTSDLIPLCHNLPLDFVSLEFEIMKDKLKITTHVKTVWKTGVEMEALLAASVAALTVYDMLKPHDESLEIQSVKLISKSGGKSDFQEVFKTPPRCAILVTSDGTFAGKRKDKSGKIIQERLEACGAEVADYCILPDDEQKIYEKLEEYCKNKMDIVFTTGGTGLSPRDVTVEATKRLIEREAPAIAEYARAFGFRRTPHSMLSRGITGVKGKTLIVNLPGSSKGASESLDALLPGIFHAFPMLAGGGHNK